MSASPRQLRDLFGDLVKSRAVWKPRPELLIHPNVPKPMHGMAPRVVLGQSWWNKEREAAYASTNYHCAACGVFKKQASSRQWLEGHECYKIDYYKGLMRYVETVPLCHYCHNYIHSGRLQVLLDLGKIHHAKYVAIVQHGDRVLKENKIVRPEPYKGPFAPWGKWRLVIGRKRYSGLFKSEAEWVAYHEEKNSDRD